MQVPLDEITGRDVQHPATGALQGNIIRRPSCKHFRVLLFFFWGGCATLLHAGYKKPLKAFADLHNTAVHH